jgi:hypothetical protein
MWRQSSMPTSILIGGDGVAGVEVGLSTTLLEVSPSAAGAASLAFLTASPHSRAVDPP